MIAKDFEKLSEIIPGTFGEAIQIYPFLKCEPHEWDNRTTIENTEWLINELRVMANVADTESKLNLADVSNWLAFDEVKPEKDKLFLITNGSFVEIAYYENGEIQKPWSFDKYDTATLKAQQNGLKWQYIDLPACC